MTNGESYVHISVKAFCFFERYRHQSPSLFHGAAICSLKCVVVQQRQTLPRQSLSAKETETLFPAPPEEKTRKGSVSMFRGNSLSPFSDTRYTAPHIRLQLRRVKNSERCCGRLPTLQPQRRNTARRHSLRSRLRPT